MRIGFWNFYSSLNAGLFVERNAPIGDDLLLPFIRLREMAAARGIECVVLSAETLPLLDAIVFIDYPDERDPTVRAALASDVPRYLLTFEPPTVRPENQLGALKFLRVFTWNDSYVAFDPRKYVKLNYASEFPVDFSDAPPPDGPPRVPLPPAEPRKMLTMIAANKRSPHPEALYYRRVEVAEFFDRFVDTPRYQFDLYGPGWLGHPSWRGTIPAGSKRATLAGYRYAVVFENGRFPGYITEKLFDCFAAGTVPLYLGAPNIRDYVPADTFIDLAQFGETWTRVGRMWEFVQRQTDGDYLHQHLAISSFLTSEAAEQFTTRRFAKTILDTIEGDLTVT